MTGRPVPARGPVQLPPPPPLLVGRDAELAALDEIAARTGPGPSVAVLTGLGGTGKSATALHWLHTRRERFPDGILYASLDAESAEIGVLLHGFLSGLGVPLPEIPHSPILRGNAYRAMTDGRRIAVLLDDAERSADVRALLPGAPGAVVLVTSRSRLPGLELDGADILVLGGLPDEQARVLVRERIRPGQIAEDDLEAVLQRCHGNPLFLAIEAVTRRGRRRTARPRLTGEFADAAKVFDASFSALPESARRTYRALGLLARVPHDLDVLAEALHCTREAAAADIADLDEQNLLDASCGEGVALSKMVWPDAGVRARDQPDLADVLPRCVQALGDKTDAGSRVVHEHRARLDAAADAVDTAVFADDPGTAMQWWHQYRDSVHAVAAQAAAHGFNEELWRLAEAAWGFFLHVRDYDSFRDLCEIGLAAARECRNAPAEALMLLQLGFIALETGQTENAEKHHQAALEIDEREQHGPTLATSCSRMARAARDHGDLELALALYQRSIDKHLEIDQPRGAAMALQRRGAILIRLGRENQAWRELHEAIRYLDSIGDLPQLVKAAVQVAGIQARRGDPGAARARLLALLPRVERIQSPHTEKELRAALADLDSTPAGAASGDAARAGEEAARAPADPDRDTAVPGDHRERNGNR
ncbi:hypothetical protein CU254_41305 (plasmid) [Amycolatopsis sp. AA4]|uniref:tetratricopeptide repeat protein n=1 Tax=Actinomycetes TaxID=1760 RepID=UPI0001B55C18|nr:MULTISPECIES: tetratricopeptide repeat protein [Actinomycetes]ATY17027.1 hypothetical protein CU254_41305 [Amycolatopsis sp. AA4]